MNYRAIIQEAWSLTQNNKSLIWWFAFIPSLLTTVIVTGYLVYQSYALWSSGILGNQGSETDLTNLLLERSMAFMQNNPGLTVLLIVMIAIISVAYIMLPVFTQGALIQLIARHKAGYPISIVEGIGLGFRRFLQFFEYQLLIKTFSFVGIFTQVIFTIRGLGIEAFQILGWIFLVVFIAGFFLTLLFTYSEYYIVIDDQGIFKGMIGSSKLVVTHWHHTLFMLILMIIISVRIIFNILVAMLIPALVIAPVLLFASLTLTKIGVVVGSVLGIVALYFASYFLGVFNVFATAVWTFTFLKLTQEEEVDLRSQIKSVEHQENEVES